MLNKSCSADKIADELSKLAPRLIRGVHKGVFVHKNITANQILVLMAIYACGEAKVGSLARDMKVSAPTMSGMVDRMVRQGVLKRSPSPQDRRSFLLTVTPKGQKMVGEFQKAIRQRWSWMLKFLTVAESRTYLELIKKIVKGMDGVEK